MSGQAFVCGACGHHPACHDWHEDGFGHQGCGHVGCSCGLAFSDVAAAAVDQIAAARVKAALTEAADTITAEAEQYRDDWIWDTAESLTRAAAIVRAHSP